MFYFTTMFTIFWNIDLFDNVSGKFVTENFFCFCDRIFFADVNRNGDDCFCLPFTCTGISTSSSFIASSSGAGHSWWNTESV